MTVRFHRGGESVHRNLKTHRSDPEPALAEIYDDPVLHAVMARDGVSRAQLEAMVDAARRRLGFVAEHEVRRVYGGRPFAAFDGLSAFEANLFAECWA